MPDQNAVPDSKSIGKRELVLLLAFLMSLNALSMDAMVPALDDMARELGETDGNRRQLVVSVYSALLGLGALLPGALADRFGRRRVVLTSIAGLSIITLLIALLRDFDTMLLARGVSGLFGAGLMVVPMAIVRDNYEGDRMARLMSVISAVFILVPVIAPSFGQGILMVAGWRWLFVALAVLVGLAGLWVWLRLPETLDPANRQPIRADVIAGNMRRALFNRGSIGYVLGTTLLIGGVFGYINSAQQLYQDHFGVGDEFPLLFGATAAMMGVASLVNSRIVMRFGARRVSHVGVLLFITVSAVQVWSSLAHPGNIWWFLPLMSVNLALLGFLGSNFGSIAMQPFSTIAGAASSAQTFVRMFGASMVGMSIGLSFDGTALPLAFSLLGTSLLALCLVLFSEQGRLFRRINPPGTPLTPTGGPR
jgi:MFS transporter, DHA1 family, multidrug resistance protein